MVVVYNEFSCKVVHYSRVFAALILAVSPFLGESQTWVNVLGAAVVTLTLALYLFLQYRTKQSKAEEAKQANETSTTVNDRDGYEPLQSCVRYGNVWNI